MTEGIELGIARFLLDAKQNGKSICSSDLLSQMLSSYSFTELMLVLTKLEHERFVQFEKEFWSITQAGIDHFFRINEGDE